MKHFVDEHHAEVERDRAGKEYAKSNDELSDSIRSSFSFSLGSRQSYLSGTILKTRRILLHDVQVFCFAGFSCLS